MSHETLSIETTDRDIATVFMDRPDKHNSFNEQVIADLTDAYRKLGVDDSVRVIVLRGRGKSFSAGADLNWMKKARDWSEAENREDSLRLAAMLDAMNNCPKATVAIAHGAVMGGGVGLISTMDVVIGVEGTKFALSEVNLGLVPAVISPYVVAAIGERHARRYMLTGERFGTDEAFRINLVHERADDMDAAEEALDKILKNLLASGPVATREIKALIQSIKNRPATSDVQSETAACIARLRVGDEAQEGLNAFFDKRKPAWTENG